MLSNGTSWFERTQYLSRLPPELVPEGYIFLDRNSKALHIYKKADHVSKLPPISVGAYSANGCVVLASVNR